MGKHTTTSTVNVWVMPRSLYRMIKRELPASRPAGQVGRPAVSHRVVLNAIWFVLWTGCQWSAITVDKFGVSKTTAHDRLRQWQRHGIWRRIWQRLLRRYQRQHRIGWQWRSADARHVPAPLGGEMTGRNPTDRGKQGVKLHLLVDAGGLPLAIIITGANRHDMTQVVPLLDAQIIAGPVAHFCADRGYDYPVVWETLQARGYTPHIRHRRRRGEPAVEVVVAPGEVVHPPRRWVVERSLGWLSKPRALRTCWAKSLDTWLALVSVACCRIVHNMTISG